MMAIGHAIARCTLRAACCAIVLLPGLAEVAAAEPRLLRLSFQLPLTGSLGVNLVRLKEAVARAAGDAVAIEILHGKQALPDRTVAKSVIAGEVEMATANVVTLADKVKGVDILSLPFLFNTHARLKAMLIDRAGRAGSSTTRSWRPARACSCGSPTAPTSSSQREGRC